MSKVPASAWRQMREGWIRRYEEYFHEPVPPLECELADKTFCKLLSDVLTFSKKSFSQMSEVEFLQLQYQAAFGESLGYNFMTIHTEEELLTALRESLKSGKPYELPDDVKRLIEQGANF